MTQEIIKGLSQSEKVGQPLADKDDRDELTGLLREKSFFAIARKRITEEKLNGWCLVSIDIEHFKLFNDWYGREAGDILLQKIGNVLEREEKETQGLAGYLGQDDFCLLIPYDSSRIDRLYEEIHELIVEQGTLIGFLPAFGISLVDGSIPVMDLLDRASLATDQVKGDFHSRIRLYRPSMHRKTEEEYFLLSEFQNGLKKKELFFCLQPRCRISTGRIVGAEALARWKTADGKVLLPAVFVPILEKYGFVVDLDQYIWEEVCIWLRSWMDAGNEPLPISINVSRVDIFTLDVPAHFEGLIEKYRLPKSALKIEITESTYVDDSSLVGEAVQKLREQGFTVLMDDFGSGYSSLNMLRSLNVDIIKLDGQFLRMDDEDGIKGLHILENIINMTKTMGVPVIVEGVENLEQVNFLSNLGCRYAQGYVFYRPMPVKDFEKLIQDENRVDRSGISFKANQQFHIREFLDRNIYSDSMLNKILGATAFYAWDGERVDIVRFNEQFYEEVGEVGVSDFSSRLTDIQRFFHPADRKLFSDLFGQAQRDRLNGATGVVRVYKSDHTMGRYLVHIFYLEEREDGKIFYGSMQDVTQFTTLQSQMNLLSWFSTDSIIFLSKHDDHWSFQIPVHGLRDAMGLSKEELQQELNEGTFYQRLDESARQQLWKITMDSEEERKGFRFPFRMKNAVGEQVELYVKTDYVHDAYSDVEYIIMLRQEGTI